MGKIVVIAASAGGLRPILQIAAGFPRGCTASVFVTVRSGAQPSFLPDLISTAGWLPASHPQNGSLIKPGHIYVAPPGRHMTIGRSQIWLDRTDEVHHARPAADPLFVSAAEAFRERVIGVVLSGGGGDGAHGLKVIQECGGEVLAQDPDEAQVSGMPQTAIGLDSSTEMSVSEITRFLRDRCAA
jgi:two-component system, chemotaxis family, protein-glutamate methylesterase/glutaminase